MDRLEVQEHTLCSNLEFAMLFINQYTPVDHKNMMKNNICKLWQHGSIQEYITAFENMVLVLPELAKENAIQAFVYSLSPHLKGFVRA